MPTRLPWRILKISASVRAYSPAAGLNWVDRRSGHIFAGSFGRLINERVLWMIAKGTDF